MKPIELTAHAIAAAFWATCALYGIIELEKGYDFLMCVVLFVCGVCACSQTMLLITDFESTINQGE